MRTARQTPEESFDRAELSAAERAFPEGSPGRACALLLQGKFDAARRAFERLEGSQPRLAAVGVALARNDPRGVLPQAESLAAERAAPHYVTVLAAIALRVAGQPGLAREALERHASRSSVPVLLELAQCHLAEGVALKAVERVRSAVELAANFEFAARLLVVALRAAGEHARALEAFEARFDPAADPDLFAFHLELLVSAGHVTKALKLSKVARAAAPADLRATYNFGVLLHAAGKEGEAQAIFEEVLAANPGHEGAAASLGLCLVHQGKVDEALAVLAGPHAAHPESSELSNALALAHLARGNGEDAERALEAAFRDPRRPESVAANLASALVTQDKIKRARPLLAKLAESTDPTVRRHAEALAAQVGGHEEKSVPKAKPSRW